MQDRADNGKNVVSLVLRHVACKENNFDLETSVIKIEQVLLYMRKKCKEQ